MNNIEIKSGKDICDAINKLGDKDDRSIMCAMWVPVDEEIEWLKKEKEDFEKMYSVSKSCGFDPQVRATLFTIVNVLRSRLELLRELKGCDSLGKTEEDKE